MQSLKIVNYCQNILDLSKKGIERLLLRTTTGATYDRILASLFFGRDIETVYCKLLTSFEESATPEESREVATPEESREVFVKPKINKTDMMQI